MKERKLRIGRIPYANLFPIFFTLGKEHDCSLYEFVDGVPSEVNRMLRGGEVDVSPSSSIEYLRNPSFYRIIEGHSISSRGPVGSIFLFSERDMEDLDNSTVSVSSQSETSVALLDIVFRKFYGISCTLLRSDAPEESGGAFLLIGDDALKYSKKLSVTNNTPRSLLTYDLGDIWYRHTGLPFVFALWIVRAGVYDPGDRRRDMLDRFIRDLDRAKEEALKGIALIAPHSPMRPFLSGQEIVSYWDHLDYDLTDAHKKGLELFRRYLKELSYIL